MGIYGYTAYSASKFALRGLAEALHHELIGHNIFVSLVFPPDTDTPGLAKGEQAIEPMHWNIHLTLHDHDFTYMVGFFFHQSMQVFMSTCYVDKYNTTLSIDN